MVGEMGLSEPGNLATLSRAFEPDVAAILLVAAAHLQFFASVDAIADAKAEILEGLRAALETLAVLPARRRIAVLGDMLELGVEEERWHREAGAAAAGRSDLIVCVGPRARGIGEGAAAAGFSESAILSVASAEEAAERLAGLLREGDAVLFKASRAVGLERAVATLAGEA
jgi:UDP-N-acetylmuramoyl-tripeptide--D-alanyl-D-alanine ligase